MSTNKSVSIRNLTIHTITAVKNEVVCTIKVGKEFADFVVTKTQLDSIIKLIMKGMDTTSLIKYIDVNITPILLMAAA